MEYTITNVQRRDEWRSRYAPTQAPDMVDYAIALEGQQGWIKLSQKVTTPAPTVGQTINGRIERDPSGNPKFKKETPGYAGTTQRSGSPQQVGDIMPKMDYVVQMLEELTGRRDAVVEPDVSQDDFLGEDPFGGHLGTPPGGN